MRHAFVFLRLHSVFKHQDQAAATTATTAAHLVCRMPTSSASEDLGPLYIYR
jgi:hypothetical protein